MPEDAGQKSSDTDQSHVARKFDATVAGIAADVGGADQISTLQRTLIESLGGRARSPNHDRRF
jgi:hypothetical protein